MKPTYRTINKLQISELHQQSEINHIAIMLRVGTRYELPNQYGIAHLWEHMMFKSSEQSNSFELLSRIESIGAEVSAYTTKEKICLHASYPQAYSNLVLDTLFEMITLSSFDQQELATEKEVIFDEIDSYDDSPYELIFDDFEDLLFQNHPLGHAILGTKVSLQQISSKDLEDYRTRMLTRENIVIAVSGELDYERLDHWTQGLPQSTPYSTTRQRINLEGCHKSIHKDTTQVHHMIGGIGFAHSDLELTTLRLLMNYLSGNAITSVLNYELREKRGICYNIESVVNSYDDVGLWGIYLGTHGEKISEALDVCKQEFNKLMNKPIQDTHLDKIKIQYLGQRLLSLDSHLNQTLIHASSMLYTQSAFDNSKIVKQIQDITPAHIQQLAQHIFNSKHLTSLTYDI